MEISSWAQGDERFTVTATQARRDGLALTCVRLDADAGSEQACRAASDGAGISAMYITELDGPLAVIAGVAPDDTASFVVRDANEGPVITTQQAVNSGGTFPDTPFLFVVLEEPHPEIAVIEGYDANGSTTFVEKMSAGDGL
jgi:hypothetical protein